jgi:hypothetical protein
MQIVIDIPDYDYRQIKEYYEKNDIVEATYSYIYHGTPLPKGHGRIMDVDKILKKMEEREEQLKDDRSMYETSCVETAIDMFGETIIEAEGSESDAKQ